MLKFFPLIISILIANAAGFIGAIFTSNSVDTWYRTVEKPLLSPPNWVFGPVWTTLFVLMGIAAYIVWKKSSGKKRRIALGVYGLQLVLNTLWSIIFFGLQSPQWAFVEIVALWLSIVSTIFLFARISKAAAWLLVPYILWVSFASYLNYMIWMLN